MKLFNNYFDFWKTLGSRTKLFLSVLTPWLWYNSIVVPVKAASMLKLFTNQGSGAIVKQILEEMQLDKFLGWWDPKSSVAI